jgi:hypothetical protein
MSHVAFVETLDGNAVDWLKAVSDEQYATEWRLTIPPRRS